MMISSLPISRVRPYLTGIFVWVGTMTLAQATANPADEPGPVEMQAPMPANHEMPDASMDPVRQGKKMGSMAPMKAKERILKVSAPASVFSTLPAFASASHLYHVGAQSTSDRQIQVGEQELWLLTAVDSPSAVKITAKVREIERERGAAPLTGSTTP